MNRLLLYLLLTVLFMAPAVQAQNDEGTSTEQQGTFPSPQDAIIYFGNFNATEITGELDNPRADLVIGVGLGYDHGKYWGMRYELFLTQAKYDTPSTVSGGLFTVVDDDMYMSSLGLVAIPVIRYSTRRLELYAGFGAGLFMSKLVVDASTLGIPVSHEERSSDIVTLGLLGIAVLSDYSSFAIEYRDLQADANFAPVTSPQDIEVGGEMIILVYKYHF